MGFLYQELAQGLREDIRQGRLQSGKKLPAVRQFAKNRGVSLNTALHTYHLLESWGYLIAQEKSGFFVRKPATAPTLPENKPFPAKSRLIRNAQLIARVHTQALDPQRIALGTAQLDASLIPTQALSQSLQRCIRHSAQQPYLYSPSAGLPECIDAICLHESQNGLHLKPDEVIITNGAMDAVAMALQTCTHPGDSVLVPSPCYSGLLLLLASLQRKVIEISANADGFNLDHVETLLKSGKVSALLITAIHQNPLGFVLPIDLRKRLVKMASAYKTPLIEDDVFGECSFDSGRPLPLKAFDTQGWVLYCNSFSKTLAAGYRIGWCTPGRFYNQCLQLRSATNLAINTPLQLTLADFIHRGLYAKHLRKIKPALMQQMDEISLAVANYFPTGTAVSRPMGGCVIWITLPVQDDKNNRGLQLFEAAALEGINIIPGSIFSASNRYFQCIRINTGARWNDAVDNAIKWLAKNCIQ